MFKKITLAMLSIFLILLTNIGYAEDLLSNPMVVKTENGQIVVNQGFYENIGNNQIFTVKHGNKVIGKIKVKELYEHYCICEPIDNISVNEISKGDSAIPEAKSTTNNNAFSNTNNNTIKNTVNNSISNEEKKLSERELAKQKREEEKALREAKKLEEKQKKEAEQAEKDRLAKIEEEKQEIQDAYVEKLAGCTRTVSFHKRTGTKMLPNPIKILNAISLYRYLDYTRYAGSHNLRGSRLIGVPFAISSMIKGMGENKTLANKNTSKDYRTEIEIIFLTPDLMKSQALLISAGDDTYKDQQQVNSVAEGLIQQNELDQYAVFQVTITNNDNSADALQLAPFKWKMVLITDTHEEVKAIKYDEALDKTLGPGQTVTGNIYFPLTDSMGNKLSTRNVKVRLQSILDKKIDINWNDAKGKPDTKTKGKVKSKKNKK